MVSSHRNNFVGDVVFVELLHIQKQLVGVGEERFLRSTEPIVHLQVQSARGKQNHAKVLQYIFYDHGLGPATPLQWRRGHDLEVTDRMVVMCAIPYKT